MRILPGHLIANKAHSIASKAIKMDCKAIKVSLSWSPLVMYYTELSYCKMVWQRMNKRCRYRRLVMIFPCATYPLLIYCKTACSFLEDSAASTLMMVVSEV